MKYTAKPDKFHLLRALFGFVVVLITRLAADDHFCCVDRNFEFVSGIAVVSNINKHVFEGRAGVSSGAVMANLV